MAAALGQGGGDPGRVHEEGRIARVAIEEWRESVASFLGVRGRQVVFTSSGTEAINTAVFAAARSRPGGRMLTADVEHSAVRDAARRFAPTEVVAVDGNGRLDVDALVDALSGSGPEAPALVNCQWANHEVGTIQPVEEVAAACSAASVPLHVDASAACGHVPLDLGALGAEYVSLSGHKFGGPPGIGVLVLRRGLRLEPFLVGGSQERERRGGIENGPAVAGLAAAVSSLSAPGALDFEAAKQRTLVASLVAAATSVEGVSLVGDPEATGRVPHIVCFGVDGVEAEPVLISLDRAGIAAHSGSSCSSESLEPSAVLAAMGLDPSRSLRLSVGWSSTEEDVAAFAEAFPGVVARLRALGA